jgi:hypothetical protein
MEAVARSVWRRDGRVATVEGACGRGECRGARHRRLGVGMLTPGHRAGWEMRKKGSTPTSTWIARLLVLGCWCYKVHRLLGCVLSSKNFGRDDPRLSRCNAIKDELVRWLSSTNPSLLGLLSTVLGHSTMHGSTPPLGSKMVCIHPCPLPLSLTRSIKKWLQQACRGAINFHQDPRPRNHRCKHQALSLSTQQQHVVQRASSEWCSTCVSVVGQHLTCCYFGFSSILALVLVQSNGRVILVQVLLTCKWEKGKINKSINWSSD